MVLRMKSWLVRRMLFLLLLLFRRLAATTSVLLLLLLLMLLLELLLLLGLLSRRAAGLAQLHQLVVQRDYVSRQPCRRNAAWGRSKRRSPLRQRGRQQRGQARLHRWLVLLRRCRRRWGERPLRLLLLLLLLRLPGLKMLNQCL